MTSIPIALGERLFTRQDVRPYFELGCIDIIQPDIAHAGGISETKKIANMAETYDIGVAPHCPLGPIAFAACLQIGFSTPNFVICEMSWKVPYLLYNTIHSLPITTPFCIRTLGLFLFCLIMAY